MSASAEGPTDTDLLAVEPRPESASLAEQIERGEELLTAAAKVADQHDLHIWRRERNAWTERTLAALAAEMRPDADFRSAGTVPHPLAAWDLAIVSEAQAVRAGVEVLRASPSSEHDQGRSFEPSGRPRVG